MHVRLCACVWGGEYFSVYLCACEPVQPVERSRWHGNATKDKKDGLWSLRRTRFSRVCTRVKTHGPAKEKNCIKYPTEINEGNLSPWFSRHAL